MYKKIDIKILDMIEDKLATQALWADTYDHDLSKSIAKIIDDINTNLEEL